MPASYVRLPGKKWSYWRFLRQISCQRLLKIAEDDMLLTQLCDQPEKARAVFTVYWQGRLKDNAGPNATIKCYVGEDWIVQRNAGGVLKFVQYINTFHQFLPDSAAIDL
jgi:hypothetical protein